LMPSIQRTPTNIGITFISSQIRVDSTDNQFAREFKSKTVLEYTISTLYSNL